MWRAVCVCACVFSVGILGLIIYAVEGCCSAGIAVIYVISILAGVLFLILGFMARGKARAAAAANGGGPGYSSSVRSCVRVRVRACARALCC